MSPDPSTSRARISLKRAALAGAAFCLLALGSPSGAGAEAPAGQAGKPYSVMPSLAPIGVRPDNYLPVPASVASPPVDPAKGYRLEKLGRDLYMVTDNAYQSMFLVHEGGVVVVDAPPAYSARLKAAIAEVTDRPVTHVVYSHAHIDHIGGVTDLGGKPVIVAQEETARLLARARDPKRPVPTVTFKDSHRLAVGGQTLELSRVTAIGPTT